MTSRGLKLQLCCIHFFVIILVLSGLFIGILASFFYIRSFQLRHFYDPMQTSIYFLYGPALFIFVISVIGWKAAKNNHCGQLKCFSALLVILIISEMVACVWNFVSIQLLRESALPLFQTQFSAMTVGHNLDAWDVIQRKLKCCGVYGVFDYKTLNVVPHSCCNVQSSLMNSTFCSSLHHTGCIYAFVQDLSFNLEVSSAASLIVALIQAPGIFASWCIANILEKEKVKDRNYKLKQKLLVERNTLRPQSGSLLQETIA